MPPADPASPPLRFAAVTSNLLLGGATTFLLNFLRALGSGPDHLSIICTGAENEHAADFAALEAKVCLGALGHLIYEDRLAWAYAQLAALQPQAVVACLGAESFEMLRLAPPGVVRLGLIQSDDPLPYALASRYHASLDAMVGVSPHIGARLRAMPEFAGVRIEAIPYGIQYQPETARLPRAPGQPLRVLYLGRLIEEQKRISRIVELVRRAEAFPGRFHFTLAGSGPEEAEVRRALAGSSIVTFTGAVPNTQVPGLLRAHDVYLLLSDYEGLPLSLLEAMGEGVVPVVSDLSSGLAELVTPAVGVRVPIGDVPAAEAALLALEQEPAQLATLSAAARERARRDYSAATMASRYLELMHTLHPTAGAPAWPVRVAIPPPLGVPPWLFRGVPRLLRRGLKALRSR